MAVQPAANNFTCYQGTSFTVQVEVTGLDITGGTPVVECALPLNAARSGQEIQLTLSPSQTASASTGSYPYELYIHLPGGIIHMLMLGYITIADGVL